MAVSCERWNAQEFATILNFHLLSIDSLRLDALISAFSTLALVRSAQAKSVSLRSELLRFAFLRLA